MGISSRTYCLTSDGVVYLLPRSRYAAMLQNPRTKPICRFSGMSIRCAEVSVQTSGSKVVQVLGMHGYWMTFDEQGSLRADLLVGAAHANHGIAQAKAVGDEDRVAAKQAVAAAGRWEPTAKQIDLILDAALGRATARRL